MMANRSPRRLKPGQHNLHGKRTKLVCPCCDPLIDHQAKVMAEATRRLIESQEPPDPEMMAIWDANVEDLYES